MEHNKPSLKRQDRPTIGLLYSNPNSVAFKKRLKKTPLARGQGSSKLRLWVWLTELDETFSKILLVLLFGLVLRHLVPDVVGIEQPST